MPSPQGRYWLGTVFNATPPVGLPVGCTWFKGQFETCPSTQRVHLQCIVGFPKAVRRSLVITTCGDGHWELTRSAAADSYVHKDDTHVPGSRFEYGAKALNRNSAKDWEAIKLHACTGALDLIPADIFVRYYRYFYLI